MKPFAAEPRSSVGNSPTGSVAARRFVAIRSYGEVDSNQRSGRVRLQPPILETAMQFIAKESTAIQTNLGAIFVSLELSRSTWLITSVSPDGGEKMSKH